MGRVISKQEGVVIMFPFRFSLVLIIVAMAHISDKSHTAWASDVIDDLTVDNGLSQWMEVKGEIEEHCRKWSDKFNIDIDQENKLHENQYAPHGYLPIIREIREHPLEAPLLVMEIDNRLMKGNQRLLSLFREADRIANFPFESKRTTPSSLATATEIPRKALNRLFGSLDTLAMNAEFKNNLKDLIRGLVEAQHHRDMSLSKMSESEKDLLAQAFPLLPLTKVVLKSDSKTSEKELNAVEKESYLVFKNDVYTCIQTTLGTQSPDKLDDLLQTFKAAEAIDYKEMFDAAYLVAQAVDEFVSFIKGRPDLQITDKEIIWQEDTPWGPIIIGGNGKNKHEKDCFLLLDLGGDDLHENNAGGATVDGQGIAVCIDAGGNDTYTNETFSQGCGHGGVGVLIDLRGDDVYQARSYSQGAALGGVGFCFDIEGNDRYMGLPSCKSWGLQSFAMFGYSILSDMSGNDSYEAQYMAQANSYNVGLALFQDGNGDDSYRARQACQGSSISVRDFSGLSKLSRVWRVFCGGIAFLSDSAGNDKYQTMSNSQGAGYSPGSLGILVDRKGDDRFQGGYMCQGVGVHFGNGMLIDCEGDDQHVGDSRCMAASVDTSIGILIDMKGNDSYLGRGVTAGGLGTLASSDQWRGISVLLDCEGDDIYDGQSISLTTYAPAWVLQRPSTAFFFDNAGTDTYPEKSKWAINNAMPWPVPPMNKELEIGNNSTWQSHAGYMGIDREKSHSNKISKTARHLEFKRSGPFSVSQNYYERLHVLAAFFKNVDKNNENIKALITQTHDVVQKDIGEFMVNCLSDRNLHAGSSASLIDDLVEHGLLNGNEGLRLSAIHLFSNVRGTLGYSACPKSKATFLGIINKDDMARVRGLALGMLVTQHHHRIELDFYEKVIDLIKNDPSLKNRVGGLNVLLNMLSDISSPYAEDEPDKERLKKDIEEIDNEYKFDDSVKTLIQTAIETMQTGE